MADIFPIEINPKSQPIECAVDKPAEQRARVNVGTELDEDVYFSAVIEKRINPYIGTDVKEYLSRLPYIIPDFSNLDGILVEDTNWSYRFQVVFRNISDNTSLGATLNRIITNQRLNHFEYDKYLEKVPFGLYAEYPTPSPLKFADQHDDLILNNFWSFHNENDITMQDIPYNLALKGAPLWINLGNTGNARTYDFRQRQWESNKTTQVVATSTVTENLIMGSGYTYFADRNYLEDNPKYVQFLIGNMSWEADWRHCIFEYVEPCESSVQLYWENRRGGIDFYPMKGLVIEQKSIKKESYRTQERVLTADGFTGSTTTNINPIYNTEVTRQFKLNSGYVSEEKARYLFDSIMESPNAWLWVHSEQKAYAVDVKDTVYEYKNFKKDKMFTYSFIVEQQHKYYA